jgi:hypothetical protein
LGGIDGVDIEEEFVGGFDDGCYWVEVGELLLFCWDLGEWVDDGVE